MKTAEQILSELENLISEMTDTMVSYNSAKSNAIPKNIMIKLDEIDGKYKYKLDSLGKKYSELSKELTEAVLLQGSTITGTKIQAVYQEGAVQWNTEKLEKLATEFPYILEAREEGKPSVAIQIIRTKEQ